MEYSTLGASRLRVSRLALGTATFGVAPTAADVNALVAAALDLGINFFDTANSYGNQSTFDRARQPSANERESAESLLGRALRGPINQVAVASKVGEPLGSNREKHPFVGCLTRDHIKEQAHRSLERLGTDRIDLYYAHLPDPTTELAETIGAFNELIDEGLIGEWAISNYSARQTAEVVATAERCAMRSPVANQVSYHLANRSIEIDSLPEVTEAARVALVAYGPLGGGLLAGSAELSQDYAGNRRWGGAGFSASDVRQATAFEWLAGEWGIKPARLALAWLLGRRNVACAVLGTTSQERLASACSAVDLDLSDEQLVALDEIAHRQ